MWVMCMRNHRDQWISTAKTDLHEHGIDLFHQSRSWEQLKHFHASHYHPTNSMFVTYGDLPLEAHLEKVASRVMEHYSSSNFSSSSSSVVAASTQVPPEPRWTTPRNDAIVCAPDPMAPVPGKETTVSRWWMPCKWVGRIMLKIRVQIRV